MSQTPDGTALAVADTTPIIALALVQQLSLLEMLYGTVWIPPAVAKEIHAGGTRTGVVELKAATYIRTVSLVDSGRADLLNDLDRGEAEAIALALERNAELLIIDERMGRRHAQRLGLNVTASLVF